MDHDQNFKNLILDYPRQALELFASAEAEALDADVQITPVRQEQLKARLGERFRELDVPLVPCNTLNDAFRAPERRQGKAQCAGNGHSLGKRCNAALASLGGSLRARREAAICRVTCP